ncbi:MAG: hypothetical protein ACREYE_05255, partial [Gammaproteobacteria bacterium]
LGISRSGGARNPHVFQYTLRFLRSGGTRPSFARDGFFTNSQPDLGEQCTRPLLYRRGYGQWRPQDDPWLYSRLPLQHSHALPSAGTALS